MPQVDNASSEASALADDDAFESLVDHLSTLEASRRDMFSSLAAARTEMSAAQLLLRQRYSDLSLEYVPTYLSPLIHVSDTFELRIREPSAAITKQPVDRIEKEAALATNPVLWFSMCPSAEVRETQRLFREVLQHAMQVCAVQSVIAGCVADTP